MGISDRKKIIGIDEDEEIFMVQKAIKKYCFPPVQVAFEVYWIGNFEEEEFVNERNILIVEIPKSSQRHYFQDDAGYRIIYKREKDRTVPDYDIRCIT